MLPDEGSPREQRVVIEPNLRPEQDLRGRRVRGATKLLARAKNPRWGSLWAVWTWCRQIICGWVMHSIRNSSCRIGMCSCGRNAMLSAQPTPQSTEIAVAQTAVFTARGISASTHRAHPHPDRPAHAAEVAQRARPEVRLGLLRVVRLHRPD